MKANEKHYPDNAALHARKAEWRRKRAALTFAEKLDALEALRERVAPIVRAREERRRASVAPE